VSEIPSLVEKVQDADSTAFDAIAGWSSPFLDELMPRLSIAASYSRLWMAVAALFAVFGGSKGRKTAVEGMAAIAATSLLANAVGKPLVPRARPTDPVPEQRELEDPDSSSFPSGHTASAAAFSGIVGRAYPSLLIPINTLAAAVGFSRVYTGVHWPSDVLAGWILGKAVAYGVDRIARRIGFVGSSTSPS
jgi:undecaprenyl-diphosphatase